MKIEDVIEVTRGVPHMGEREGRKLYEHVCATGPEDALEIGTAWGVSACYIAAALEEVGRGRLTTVDHRDAAYGDPSADELFRRAGLERWIDRVRVADSSYTWWLMRQLEQRMDDAGNAAPAYDFCFLDGSHNWTIDGLSVFLVERLLKPGGWLLLDDVDWSYGAYEGEVTLSPPSDKMFPLSADELRTPHVRAVVDVIVRGHPSFGEVRIQDGRWAWCLKDQRETRRMSVETSRPVSVLASLAAERAARRVRGALGRARSG